MPDNAVSTFLTHSQPSPGFYVSTVCLENTVRKGEIARNEQFLLFTQCFLPFWRTFCHFYQTQNCRLQTLSFWRSLKFAVWERVHPLRQKFSLSKVEIIRRLFFPETFLFLYNKSLVFLHLQTGS